MTATAAEANPTVFSPHPLADVEDAFILPYLRFMRAVPPLPSLPRSQTQPLNLVPRA